MDRAEVARRVRDFISSELMLDDSPELTDETPLLDDLIDSVGLMELVTFLEDEFQITIDHEDLDRNNWRSVTTIAQLVETLRERQGVSSA
jgi:acyl carrier protein